MSAPLEQLKPGVRVTGLDPSGPVVVVTATMSGDQACSLVIRTGAGDLRDTIVFRDKEPELGIEGPSAQFAFTADGEFFRLASEAQRIRLAYLFDPMQAVFTSTIEPLPHQIRAVYEDMLPRQPLRYLLADDPGAGKTIMAGLLIKELMLRGTIQRCLIVAPGILVQQWKDELDEKFDLPFDILTPSDVDNARTGNPFTERDLWIARVHQLSRSDELRAKVAEQLWDLVVVDEAHRMSAHVFGNEVKKTQLYELGELLGECTRNLLLMTATPHNGKDEDFQLFMALLDADRFVGKPRDGIRTGDVADMMRRMVKENLLHFNGTRLFPERIAKTVEYPLSPMEASLYEAVTDYVVHEMNRADQIAAEEGGNQRRNRVGFALTILQRRLASSPEAIYQSLRRRRRKLEERIAEERGARRRADLARQAELDRIIAAVTDDPDALEDLDGEEQEAVEEEILDDATTARTVAELESEVDTLRKLEHLAEAVRQRSTDRKWTELAGLLDTPEMYREAGSRRKLIVFTEHRDTLTYLTDKLRTLLGRDEAVVAISGSTGRDERRRIQVRFTQDKDCTILVATDAAGEGVNLQAAHLLVNYDLPWNPNRIEQRFGRIHRIGQHDTCFMWNLVAAATREGAVFRLLLDKLEEQRDALGGQVFNVLGKALSATALRDLLIDAIRHNDDPVAKARITQVIDARVGDGLRELIDHEALAPTVFDEQSLHRVRAEMEEAAARRLQPHHIRQFFTGAFGWAGGRMRPREPGRYEVTHVPRELRDRDRLMGRGLPVGRAYERVTFERERTREVGLPVADLLAPGHPLMDALIGITSDRLGGLLRQGAVLVDPTGQQVDPWVLVYMEHAIADGRVDAHGIQQIVSRRFVFVALYADGTATTIPEAPYLDYRPVAHDEAEVQATARAREFPWLAGDLARRATQAVIATAVPEHLAEVRSFVEARIERTRRLVRRRLQAEIHHWDAAARDLRLQAEAGKQVRKRPEDAERVANDLAERLDRRMHALDLEAALDPKAPQLTGAALVLPQGYLDIARGTPAEVVEHRARQTAEVERRAVAAVLAAEHRLGRLPTEMPPNNPGFDIRSATPDGHLVFIEVKGRISGSETFSPTYTEVMHARNSPDNHILALVEVRPDGIDDVRYIPGDEFTTAAGEPGWAIAAVTLKWADMWQRGTVPV